jgi:hypothetical protein
VTTRTTAGAALLASLVTLGAAVSLAQVASIRKETVRFAKGASEATIAGRLQGDQTVDYVVGAKAGQRLAVALKKTNPQTYFNVLPPGSEDVAMHVGQDGGAFQGVLPDDGDYTVRVYLMRAAARRNERSEYTLTIGVTGQALAPIAASQDALVPGTRFHASATVACTAPFETTAGECSAFVLRRSPAGSGTVELRSKGRIVRRILFVDGKPVASDATEAPSAARTGDDTIVTFGSDERYVIPDALVRGG